MDITHLQAFSPRQSTADFSSNRSVVTPFDPGTTPVPPGTLREHDTQLQELRRENFNLKLRIFFLEENYSADSIDESPRTSALSSRFPSQHEFLNSNVSPRARSSSQDPSRSTRHSPQNATERQNETSDEKIHQLNIERDPVRYLNRSDINDNPTATKNDSTMSNQSNSYQIQLNDYKKREQTLLNERNTFERDLRSCEAQAQRREREWQKREQHYEEEIHHLRENEGKQKRVLDQLKRDYDDRVIRLDQERQKLIADQESYRHEQDANPSENVNVDHYLRQIQERDRMINELRNQIRSSPSSMPSDQTVRNLENQIRKYQDDIGRLQTECDRLRRDEIILRQQITNLTRLIDPVGTHGLPPRPSQSPTTLTQLDSIQDPQKAVVQMSLQLRNDTENLTNITDRVQQLVRERDDLQKKVRDVDALKQQFDQREDEVQNRIEQRFKVEIEMLRNENNDSHEQIKTLKDRVQELGERLRQEQQTNDENLHDVQRRFQQEKQNLENEIEEKNNRIDQLEKDLTRQLGQKLDLDEQISHSAVQRSENVEQIENEIDELRRLMTKIDQERNELKAERDFEREESHRVREQHQQLSKERAELRDDLDQLRTRIEEEQHQIERFNGELERERQNTANLNDEIENLLQRNQALEGDNQQLQMRLAEIAQSNQQLEENFRQQLDEIERNHRQNRDDLERSLRQQRDEIETNSRQNRDDLEQNFQKLENDYLQAQQELEEMRNTAETKENEIKALHEQINALNENFVAENEQRQKDLEDLQVKIHLQIDEKHQEEFQQALAQKDNEIDEQIRHNEQLKNQLKTLQEEDEENLRQIDDLERQKKRLEENLQRAHDEEQQQLKDRIDDLERQKKRLEDNSQRAYEDEQQQLKDRIDDLERQKKRLEDNSQRAYEDEQQQLKDRIDDLERQKKRLEENAQRAYEDGQQQAKDRYERIHQDDRRAFDEDRLRQENQIQQLRDELRTKSGEIDRLSRASAVAVDSPKSTSSSNYQRLAKNSSISIDINQTTPAIGNNDELIQQLRTKLDEQNRLIEKLRNESSATENEAETTQIKLRIRIQELEGDLDHKAGSIQLIEDEIHQKEEETRQLRENLNQTTLNGELDKAQLQQEIAKRDEIIDKQQSTIRDREEIHRQLDEQIQRQTLEILRFNEQLKDAQAQQNLLDELRDENERLQINFRITLEEKDDQIHLLEKDLQMSKANTAARENLIGDLQAQLQQRQKQYDNLRVANQNYEEQLKRAQQTATKPPNYVPRPQPPLPTQQNNGEQLNRTIETLRQEIKQLKDNSADLQDRYNRLVMKNNEQKSESADTSRLQQENRRLNDENQQLRQQIRTDRGSTPPRSGTTTTVNQPKGRREHELLTRDELLFELERADDQIKRLNELLEAKSPNVTALHHQITDVRKELERQKYVNQVLWRKVNVCMDVHINGANTRAELTHELANYQDELAKLKIQQSRFDDKRSSIPTVHSASSENLKSTIEWQTKVARLTERLGRSESESRNFQRDLIKCQKLLNDVGLLNFSSRHRRRSADDSIISSSFETKFLRKKHDEFDQIENLDELKRIVRTQNKFLQQLQTRIRLNTSDVVQSPTIDKLNEQIQNLNKIIETYKTESNLIENELKKLYKTIEKDRTTLDQYENLIKDQQKLINKYKNSSKKALIDDFLIDLNIEVVSDDEKSSHESADRKDSGIHSAHDANEYQRQINDKDEQIHQLTRQLQSSQIEVSKLTDLLRNRPTSNYSPPRQQTNGRDPHGEIQDLRRQLDDSNGKSTRLNDENQQLRNQIGQLEPLLEHYKREIQLLEKQVKNPPIDGKTSNVDDISIRRLDLAELLDEMRNLRRNLEISINKQNELQLKLDENLRQSRTPREFTFSGRGVSYPDLRLTEASGSFNPENLSPLTIGDERRSRPAGLSATEFDLDDNERTPVVRHKQYTLTEVQTYAEIRRLVEHIKFDLKALTPESRDRGRLNALDECLNQTLALLEQFWKAELPERNQYDEHPFTDVRLFDENKRLVATQRRLAQDVEHLRRKYKEQATHLDQVLNQLTKANRKKAETGDYLALLLRPTLDALQKARTNIEHHLQESNSPPPLPVSSANSQSPRHHRRRHHHHQQTSSSNRQD